MLCNIWPCVECWFELPLLAEIEGEGQEFEGEGQEFEGEEPEFEGKEPEFGGEG